ncbi:MAG: cupin domain-containing protein [Clostridiales bacterium]|nr:cupin domain-containing protein [Clostridiales bacterium]
MSSIPKLLHFDRCEWEEMREKVLMKCFQGQNMTIQYAEITPGHRLSPHAHEYEQIAMILQGECDFFVDGIAYSMKAGSIMSIPPMAEHYIKAKGSEAVLNLDIFYPKRSDRNESVETEKPYNELL